MFDAGTSPRYAPLPHSLNDSACYYCRLQSPAVCIVFPIKALASNFFHWCRQVKTPRQMHREYDIYMIKQKFWPSVVLVSVNEQLQLPRVMLARPVTSTPYCNFINCESCRAIHVYWTFFTCLASHYQVQSSLCLMIWFNGRTAHGAFPLPNLQQWKQLSLSHDLYLPFDCESLVTWVGIS